jgi:small subunit ribosomal protein S16
MATVIRLKRGGRTHAPYYRVVVIDSRHRNRGPEIDILGYYHPQARPQPVAKVDGAKALQWLKSGAQPSDTVRNILSEAGIWAAFKTGVPLAGEAAVAPEPVVASEPVAQQETATTVSAE